MGEGESRGDFVCKKENGGGKGCFLGVGIDIVGKCLFFIFHVFVLFFS